MPSPQTVRLTLGQLGLLVDFTLLDGTPGTTLDRGHDHGKRVVRVRFGAEEILMPAATPVLILPSVTHACIRDDDWSEPLSQARIDHELACQRAADARRLAKYRKRKAEVEHLKERLKEARKRARSSERAEQARAALAEMEAR